MRFKGAETAVDKRISRKRGIKQEDVVEEGKAIKLQRRRQKDKEDSSS